MIKVNKKMLPLLLGSSIVLVGCGHDVPNVADKYIQNIETKNDVEEENKVVTTTNQNQTTIKSTTTTTTQQTTTSENSSTSTTLNTTTTVDFSNTTTAQQTTIKAPQNLVANIVPSVDNFDCTWEYNDTLALYYLMDGETITSVSEKLFLTRAQFLDINPQIDPTNEALDGIWVVNYAVKQENCILNTPSTLDIVSQKTGVYLKELTDLNNYGVNDVLPAGTIVRTHNYVGRNKKYKIQYRDSYPMTVELIYNNRIVCEQAIYGTRFAGSSQNVLVIEPDRNMFWKNTVKLYQFNGGDKIYDCIDVCKNASGLKLDDSGRFNVVIRENLGILLEFVQQCGYNVSYMDLMTCDYDDQFEIVYNDGDKCLRLDVYSITKTKQYSR